MIFLCLLLLTSLVGPDTVSILTINVWSGLTHVGALRSKTYESKEERSFRYGLLTNGLKELDPDIIALNEANMLPGYAKRLARDLGREYVYSVSRGGVRLGPVGFPINVREGEAILSRSFFNIVSLGSRGLSGGYAGNFASFHFQEATGVLGAKITIGERDVFLFVTQWHRSEFDSSTNLSSLVESYTSAQIEGGRLLELVADAVEGHAIRLEEARKTLAFIDEIAGDNPVILMGNLNTLPFSGEIALVTESGFRDAWEEIRDPGYTWDESANTNVKKIIELDGRDPSDPGRHRIDYIFFRGEGLRVVSAKTVLDETTFDIHPSSHYGVMVEIDFNDP